jgi:hypothetical protein
MHGEAEAHNKNMDPLVLPAGQAVPDDVMDDPVQCERPVQWVREDGQRDSAVAHAWMSRINLRYYRRMFYEERQHTNEIMELWQVPGETMQQVMEVYQELETRLFDPALDEQPLDVLKRLAEAEWAPRQVQIHGLVEAYRPAP